ncbi:MAG: hypothetical protein ACKPKO_21775, partial [Candidatus Fonsibacter sp.]
MPELTIEHRVRIASGGGDGGFHEATMAIVCASAEATRRPQTELFFHRTKGVFGIRAVVGHTGMPFLEDNRLMVDVENVPHDYIP